MAVDASTFINNVINAISNIGTFMLTLFGFKIANGTIKSPSLSDFLTRVIEIAVIVIIAVIFVKKIINAL